MTITYKDGIGYETNEDGTPGYEVDDGTMPANVAALGEAIVGHRIVAVDREPAKPDDSHWSTPTLGLTLDDGRTVVLSRTDDCCAYTDLEEVIEHLPVTDHIITAVKADHDFERWHIVADLGEVLELQVGWSSGNPFYYGYGFDISVVNA